MTNFNDDLLRFFQEHTEILAVILILILVDIVLKLIALWYAARRKQYTWFIALGIVNSLGVLPAIYLILNQKKDEFQA